MPNLPYPTLSEVGLVYDANQKIEWIFADYCAAKHSQSTIFHNAIASFSYDEFEGSYDGMRTAEILQKSLEQIYGAYFDSADFEVTDNSEDGSSELRLIVKGVVVQDGKHYQLNEALAVNNSKINRISQFNR